MQIFVNDNALNIRIKYLKSKNRKIGFVPTMGALHQGHISLIEESNKKCDITVCSIFVNPTQFNNKEDLIKYPRTIKSDLAKLKKAGVDIVFKPTEEVIYPSGKDTSVFIDLEGIDEKWDGKFRPGHFNGVVQVVKRLLDIVEPDCLFMGQKDFQQFTIVDLMLNKFKMNTKLIVVPIYREKDGLAMSSRNIRLTPQFRKKSIILFEMLNYAKNQYGKLSASEIEEYALDKITEKGLIPEYFKLIDATNLDPVKEGQKQNIVVVVAAWAGDVRLIDNMII